MTATCAAVKFRPFDTRALLPAGKPNAVVRALVAKFPVITFDELMHKGAPSKHKPDCDSLEGCLLSVSEDPDAWDEIFRGLKGQVWNVRLADSPFRLIAMRRIRGAVRRSLREVGISLGLIRKAAGYRISWWDEDDEATRYITVSSKREADSEMQEEGRTLTKQDLYIATPKLARYWGLRHGKSDLGERDADEALAAYLAEWTGTHHGLWWQDAYAPERLSCPRGGLFQSVLARLEVASAD